MDRKVPPHAPFHSAETRRKRMEEVINILGSWLPWANLAAICVVGWSIEGVVKTMRSLQYRISAQDRVIERQSGVIAKLMKPRKPKKKL